MDADEAVRLRRAICAAGAAVQHARRPTRASRRPRPRCSVSIVGRGPVDLPELVRLEHINPTMLSRVVGKARRRRPHQPHA